MEITKVHKNDLDLILKYTQEEFPHYQIDEAKLTKKYDNTNFIFLKAVEEGKLLGFVEMEVYEPVKKFARINGVVVDKKARKKGVGKQLLQTTVDLAHEMEMRLITLLVEKQNTAAKKLYDRVGFNFMMDLETQINGKEIEQWEIILRREHQLRYMH